MEKQARTHRVGSVTAGLSMIGFGILFIVHLFYEAFDYAFIFKLWPIIIIGLGIELLLSNLATEKLVYDKGAIFLLVFMSFFAMGMAGADMIFTYCREGLF